MEVTVSLTPEQMESLKKDFPGMTPDEAAVALFRSELEKRCRVQLKRARVVTLQGLKKHN